MLINKIFIFFDLSVSVYYFPTEEEDDEDGPTMKEKMVEAALKGIETFCVWDCCWFWLKLQEWIAWVVFDPFVELFITLCIVINTLFMALDHHNMDGEIEKVLKAGNYVRLSRPQIFGSVNTSRFNTFYNSSFRFSFSLQHSLLKRRWNSVQWVQNIIFKKAGTFLIS